MSDISFTIFTDARQAVVSLHPIRLNRFYIWALSVGSYPEAFAEEVVEEEVVAEAAAENEKEKFNSDHFTGSHSSDCYCCVLLPRFI